MRVCIIAFCVLVACVAVLAKQSYFQYTTRQPPAKPVYHAEPNKAGRLRRSLLNTAQQLQPDVSADIYSNLRQKRSWSPAGAAAVHGRFEG